MNLSRMFHSDPTHPGAAEPAQPAAPSSVFPDRMTATCPSDHAWSVQVTWRPVHVPGSLVGSPLMQVPSPEPQYCLQCFLATRRAVRFNGLQHLVEASS